MGPVGRQLAANRVLDAFIDGGGVGGVVPSGAEIPNLG